MKRFLLAALPALLVSLSVSAQNTTEKNTLDIPTKKEEIIVRPQSQTKPVVPTAQKISDKANEMEKVLELTPTQKQQLVTQLTSFFAKLDKISATQTTDPQSYETKRRALKNEYITEFSKQLTNAQKAKFEEYNTRKKM